MGIGGRGDGKNNEQARDSGAVVSMKGVLCALALLASVGMGGCFGSGVDEPDLVRLMNEGSHEGEAVVRFVASDGAVAEEVPVLLSPGSTRMFTANLTSEVRYRAEVSVENRTLRSEPFFTGLGPWQVHLTLTEDAVRVVTVHAD